MQPHLIEQDVSRWMKSERRINHIMSNTSQVLKSKSENEWFRDLHVNTRLTCLGLVQYEHIEQRGT